MPNNNAPQPPATPTRNAQTVTNAKTAAELWNALYRWATAVLPKKVKVVKSHQDMASVKGTFICINYAGSWNLAGSNASKMIDNRPDLPSPRVFVYRGTVEIREVEGDGDFLMQAFGIARPPGISVSFERCGTFRIEGGGAARNAVPATGPMAQGIALDAYNVLGSRL